MQRSGVAVGAVSVFDDVIDVVDWTDVRHVVQIAGGRGAFLSAILRRLPTTTGVLFDAPEVIAEAGPTLYAAGVADRVDCAGGDLFHDIPPGGDLYVVAHVLWSWTDERVVRLLKLCHDVMPRAARLVLAEPSASPARGCEAWRDVLAEAGFTLLSTRAATFGWCVVEAAPL
ncbi:MAG: hypothetical protein QOI61_765 [Actinomycetota bacterium]